MPRLPYSAQALLLQVCDAYPESSYEPGELDGFGVWRTIRLDPAVSAWLAPLLDLGMDRRLADMTLDEGVLTLRFTVSSSLADDAASWDLPPPPGF